MNQVVEEQLTLAQLQPGQAATVVELTSIGLNRRRMMDLGILPGTHIEVELISAGGDPTAYRIRGAVIALRKAQAQEIHITLDTKVTSGVQS
jgi:Fe2+ transport system protein FeoA